MKSLNGRLPHPDVSPMAIPALPKAVKVVLCVLGIYVCFLSQGLIQEALYASPIFEGGPKFRSPLFLVAIVCLFAGLLGFTISVTTSTTRVWQALLGDRSPESRELIHQGFLTSLSYVGAMACTNFALTQVNYPTQVLVKSAKAVPVVLGGWLMYGKRYPLIDYLMVAVVTTSLIVFQLSSMKSGETSGESHSSKKSVLGFIALFASLSFDGMTGPRQDRLVSRFRLGTGEMMLLINAFAFPLCLGVSLLVEGMEPWVTVASQLGTFMPKILALVVTGACGQVFVVQVLQDLGSLQLTLITTSRKFLTILLSVLWFSHALSLSQWSAVVMLFAAVVFKYLAHHKQKPMKPRQD